MRGLLRLLAVFLPAAVACLLSSPGTEAATQVDLFMMPGANGTTTVTLTCGFHGACVAPWGDPEGALDFVKNGGSSLGESVSFRTKGLVGSSSSIIVAKAVRSGAVSDMGCDYAWDTIYKPNGTTYIGRYMYLHVAPFGPSTANIFGKNYPGHQTTIGAGVLADDENEEQWGCYWYGAHLHQDMQLDVGVVTAWGRGAYPSDVQCGQYGCSVPKTIWNDWHVWYRYSY